uniref:Anoctamin dimerisation domain-containing protein n=1 Tax=Knipowitschia caucasica TaxID=637954 RepID=A0AAV2L4I2_KNICA
MTQQGEEEDKFPPVAEPKQSSVHFLRDVVFHGKFELLKSATPEESTCFQKGLYFTDGQRRVDYVLSYNLKKTCGSRISRYVPHMQSENAVCHKDTGVAPPQRAGMRSTAHGFRGEISSPGEEDKILQREDFESKLRDMGLELEKEDNGNVPGVGFVKIHAPWNVLCREAEFMKLKMPTKKCYEVKQSSGFVEKLMSLASKAVEPLYPHVEEHHPKHIKYLSHTFSREKQHLYVRSLRTQK